MGGAHDGKGIYFVPRARELDLRNISPSVNPPPKKKKKQDNNTASRPRKAVKATYHQTLLDLLGVRRARARRHELVNSHGIWVQGFGQSRELMSSFKSP